VKRWILLFLFGIGSTALAASEVRLGCTRFRLLLDARLSPAIVDREWASGSQRPEAPAVLELRGCQGQLLDRLILEAPLARLDPAALRGAPAPTYLVSVDLTAEAGSYNGPLTIPIQVVHNHLMPAVARTPDGRLEPIRLALTGKAAWKKAPVRKVDDLLSVSSQPKDQGFITFYRRYHPTRRGWQVKVRSEAGMWESDGEFPETRLFPLNAVVGKDLAWYS
jgi:hypothetical protein